MTINLAYPINNRATFGRDAKQLDISMHTALGKCTIHIHIYIYIYIYIYICDGHNVDCKSASDVLHIVRRLQVGIQCLTHSATPGTTSQVSHVYGLDQSRSTKNCVELQYIYTYIAFGDSIELQPGSSFSTGRRSLICTRFQEILGPAIPRFQSLEIERARRCLI